MKTLKATWQNGQLVLDEKPDWPDGKRLEVVDEESHDYDFQFMTEEEQGDDPESIQRWLDELHSIPPMPPMDAEEIRKWEEWEAWRKKVKEFNIEAMRKQFEENQL